MKKRVLEKFVKYKNISADLIVINIAPYFNEELWSALTSIKIRITLYPARSWTTQERIASLPTGAVTLAIGSLNLGSKKKDKIVFLWRNLYNWYITIQEFLYS